MPTIPHLPIPSSLKPPLQKLLDPNPSSTTAEQEDYQREEARKRRASDLKKGFAYFDEVEQIEAWSADSVESAACATVPLMPRGREWELGSEVDHYHQQQHAESGDEDEEVSSCSLSCLRTNASNCQNTTSSRKARLILCHDYAGGYHDYESANPDFTSTTPDPLYVCSYLSYVDKLIYFSHHFVSVPPASWINVCHRNGVLCLGTVITEPGTQEVDRLLEMIEIDDGDENGGKKNVFWFAEKLALMAKVYGFDGWLLNFEKAFPSSVSAVTAKVVSFIQQLKEQLGSSGFVLWYDALTIENKVSYQNGLSAQNFPFAKAAHQLFTNYRWDESKLSQAVKLLDEHGLERERVAFGIDVWAQNDERTGGIGDLFPKRRVTWPRQGGGGTNIGVAVNKLAEYGFAAAVFAPGWTSEHFHGKTAMVDSGERLFRPTSDCVAQAIWEAASLPSELVCDCHSPGSLRRSAHLTREYRRYPITGFAQRFPAGTESYFYSDLRSGIFRAYGEDSWHGHLGAQSVLPYTACESFLRAQAVSRNIKEPLLFGRLDHTSSLCGFEICVDLSAVDEGGQSYGMRKDQREVCCTLDLFHLDMDAALPLQAKVHWDHFEADGLIISWGFELVFVRDGKVLETQRQELQLPQAEQAGSDQEAIFSIRAKAMKGDVRLVRIGFYCEVDLEDTQRSTTTILKLRSILISAEI